MTDLQRALLVAERAHRDQTYDIYPYYYHIKKVADLAVELGYDETIQVAAVLHDVLEDTPLSYSDIKKAFGETVAEIVFAVTDELGRNRAERKAKTYPKIRANRGATLVKILDRIANMEHSLHWNQRMLQTYWGEHPTFRKELWSIDADPEVNRAWNRLHQLYGRASELLS